MSKLPMRFHVVGVWTDKAGENYGESCGTFNTLQEALQYVENMNGDKYEMAEISSEATGELIQEVWF